MNADDVELRRADESDLAYVESLLRENRLPAVDVRSKPECFFVASHGDERVGVGGIEVYDGAGLLRSVVVEREVRGNGFGTALCDALEERARSAGAESLYLLTTSAAAFFAERGYETADRSEAPESVRSTTEFEDLCPTSAACLRKPL